jgi:hypothetical protein
MSESHTNLTALARANRGLSLLDLSRFHKLINEEFKYRINDNGHHSKPRSKSVVVGERWVNLIERYVNREIGICVHFHSGNESIKAKARDFAFVFQKAFANDVHMREGHALGKAQFGTGIGGPGAKHVELSMPIFPRPIVQNAKSAVDAKNLVNGSDDRSIVRLYLFNEVSQLLREWPYLRTGVIECFLGDADRELQMLLIGGWIFFGLQNNCLIDDAVKGRAELIEKLADLEREGSGDWMARDDMDGTCPVAIHLQAGSIGIILKKGFPGLGDSVAVSLCAYDALPTPLEWPHESTFLVLPKPSTIGQSSPNLGPG